MVGGIPIHAALGVVGHIGVPSPQPQQIEQGIGGPPVPPLGRLSPKHLLGHQLQKFIPPRQKAGVEAPAPAHGHGLLQPGRAAHRRGDGGEHQVKTPPPAQLVQVGLLEVAGHERGVFKSLLPGKGLGVLQHLGGQVGPHHMLGCPGKFRHEAPRSAANVDRLTVRAQKAMSTQKFRCGGHPLLTALPLGLIAAQAILPTLGAQVPALPGVPLGNAGPALPKRLELGKLPGVIPAVIHPAFLLHRPASPSEQGINCVPRRSSA